MTPTSLSWLDFCFCFDEKESPVSSVIGKKKLTRLSKDQGKLRGIFNLCENAVFYL